MYDKLYLSVLEGKKVMFNNWNGLWLSDNTEYIFVQGAGSWHNRTDDKEAFIDDVTRLAKRYGEPKVVERQN